MKPISSISLLMLVCLFLTEFHATNAKGLINKACETSLHRDLCVATLKSDADYKGAKLHNLAEIVLKAATSNATALQK